MATALEREVAVPWPLARRVAAGLDRPGGEAMTRRALEGAGLVAGERVVALSPGLGRSVPLIVGSVPRSLTLVEPDAHAAEHLGRAFPSPVGVVGGALAATGLDDRCATLVVLEGLLTTLVPAARAPVLDEAARLLAPSGRVVVHELAPPEHGPTPTGLIEAGVHPVGAAGLRALMEGAGLVVVGSLEGMLEPSDPRDLMRTAGPRTALALTRELARDAALRASATAARRALEDARLVLRSVIVVAERPLILGMRRPRR